MEHELDLKGVKVLVVEEDGDSRAFVEILLVEQGAEVTAVSSGPEALAELTVSRPDVLVADLGMSGMDGYRLLMEIREQEESSGWSLVPALALTGFDDMNHMIRAGHAGYRGFIAKPIDPVRLVQTVAELAGRWSYA